MIDPEARICNWQRIGRYAYQSANWMERIGRALTPLVALGVRFWLGPVFLFSGLLKLADWNAALLLSTYEYPVSWLAPETAALLGLVTEVGGGALMIAGLATRGAALSLAILSIVVQTEYLHLNEHIYWAILCLWLVVHGPGPLSLDHLITRGAYSSALPLAQSLERLFLGVGRFITPVFLLGLRLFLTMILAVSALGVMTPDDQPLLLWFSFDTASLPSELPRAAAAAIASGLALLIASGLSLRLTALVWGSLLTAMILNDSVRGLGRIDALYWLILLSILVVHGAGRISIDWIIHAWLTAAAPTMPGLENAKRVVVVGAGFGGVSVVRGLRNAPCRCTLIDRRNYHLFQPLLYQVATAGLSPADIATPIRELFREQPNARVIMGRVTDIDRDRQEVMIDEQRIAYDYLVIATGARHAYFGNEEWEPFAPGLKKIDDATEIRRRLLTAFEEAENTDDPEAKKSLLTFVIVGGGPTGVELAGAFAELARHGMTGEFRSIDPSTARVLLIQAAPRLLPTFPEALSTKAQQALEALGVEVLTSSRVESINEQGVILNGTFIGARSVFWAAGVQASPAAKWLAVEADPSGRIKVGTNLQVPGATNIFAIGDTALATAWNGDAVPGLAPAAKQAGKYVAKAISAMLSGRKALEPFRYRHRGNLATIGRSAAVADFAWLRLSGSPAWWLWGIVHIYFLAGTRNRLSVAIEWFWAYLTFRRGTRLITGGQD